MSAITYAMASTTGSRHKFNQDEVFASAADRPEIFMIADGIGAEPAGQRAAQLVVQTVETQLRAQPIANANKILPALTEAYRQATRAIQQQRLDAVVSVTTVYIHDGRVYIGHVGNTRAYLVARQSFEQLTTDHTIEEKTIEFGMDFSGNEYAPVLYRALGQADEMPDTLLHPLAEGVGLLLITDGIYRAGAHLIEYDGIEQVMLPLDDKQIVKIIRDSNDDQSVCDNLIAAAQDQGGSDNLSALFISNGFVFKKA